MFKKFNILTILAVIVLFSSPANSTKSFCNRTSAENLIDCGSMFNMIHKCNGEFVNHAMNVADPFKMCTFNETFVAYRLTMQLYEKLLTTPDPKNPKEFCSGKYLNKNRMSVISTVLGNSMKLWNDANCDLCYTNISVDQTLTNNTQAFTASLADFNACVKNHTNHNDSKTTVCDDCVADYQTLNKFYEQLKKDGNGKICFDLEDYMNKTRRDWSGLYKCCREKRDSLTAFYSLSSAVFVIAIGFYSVVYWVGSQNPQTELLDERGIVQRQSEPSQRPTASSSGPSSTSRLIQPKKTLIINQDESDDEIIIGAKPVAQENANLISLDN